MKTFKIVSGLMIAAAACLFTACDDDRGDNPKLDTDNLPTSFVLNTPAYASNTYDLSKSATVNLTCSQPNYGGEPLAVTYAVQVSLNKDFTAYSQLSTTYTSANMDVNATEMNNAIVKLYQAANDGADPTNIVMPVYVRLRATLSAYSNADCLSNVIELPKVVTSYLAELPTSVFVTGPCIQDGTTFKKLAAAYGVAGKFFTMIYAPAGGTFSWSEDGNTKLAYKDITTINDNAKSGVKAAGDGSIQIANAGWYVVYFNISIDAKKNKVITELNINPGEAYVIGAVAGGAWNTADANWKMVAPADATGQWTSPAFAGDGELRAYIYVDGIEWWRTEFTLYKSDLYWRTVDIPSNWAKDVGAAYSVSCTKGQKLYVDFDKNTGEVK
jgi:hypothetical protein